MKKGLETYSDLIKTAFIRQDKDIELQLLDYNYIYIHNNQLNYDLHYSLELY